jgi:hypothetical protein
LASIDNLAALLFGAALIHTFCAKQVGALARRHPRHAGLFHLLGEVEVVFGFWAFLLILAMALVRGSGHAIAYAESRRYTEPLFVFVVMVMAAAGPIQDTVTAALAKLARRLPLRAEFALTWLALALLPLCGSLITEPAAMTLAALSLTPLVFRRTMPEWLKYATLGVLFVNVSIGGTLTAFAAPPIVMVASGWHWDSAFMASRFGWRAAVAVCLNASALLFLLRRHLVAPTPTAAIHASAQASPTLVAVHFGLLGAVIALAHHPELFLGVFLLFLGVAQSYPRHQRPLILKPALLVAFFLAGLVVLGGAQQWWLQPLLGRLGPGSLFAAALGLTAITDNAALTYLGSLAVDLTANAKYMLVAGAVAGGGLTVIANAPNPAGAALLRHAFDGERIGTLGLLLGALPPTSVAALAFLL